MKTFCVPLIALCALCAHALPNLHDVQSAIDRAQEINAVKKELSEISQRNLGSSSSRGCPLARFHARRVPDSSEQDKRSNDVMLAARILLQEGYSAEDLQHPTVLAEFSRQLGSSCPSTPVCDNSAKYRTADGTCNNLNTATWGMAGSAQRRLLPAAYDDGLGTPRSRGVDNSPLPNPRQISNNIHRGAGPEVRSNELTLHAFQLGQFLDHDIIATPVQSVVADCCAAGNDVDNCININFDRNDRFSPRYTNGYCMGIPRSSANLCPDSTVRQQTNDITSFIDASNVYGSSQEQQDELRNGAFMKVVTSQGDDRLPNNPDNTACHSDTSNGIFCSLAGDSRVNVVPSLTAYHNVFVLEHNRIASELRPSISDDETLFQETRKIIIAIMQKIVYDEFLPSFLSPAAMTKYGLNSSAAYTYDATLDPTIANAFGIAYRMGHTWIPNDMSVFDRRLRPFLRRETDETFEDPTLTYLTGDPSGMAGLAYWLSGANSPETDKIVQDVVRNNLFQDNVTNTAFDLVALNIQRGRDHGLPSYNEYRQLCGLSAVLDWGDSAELNGLVDHDLNVIGDLRRNLYRSPQDIDLFTGALTERAVAGGTVGPTLECILGDQFKRLKFGDRFWYQGVAAGLTAAQQMAVQSYSMSKLMCENYNFAQIHFPNAFLSTNTRTQCNNIDPLNTSVFQPTPPTTPAPTPPPTTAAPPPPRPPPNGGGGGNRRPPPPRDINGLLEKLIHELEDVDKNNEK